MKNPLFPTVSLATVALAALLIAKPAAALEQPHSFDTFAINSARVASDESQRMAYVNQRLQQAQKDVRNTPWLRDNAGARKAYYQSTVRDAESLFERHQWRGGWFETSLKAVGNGGLALAAGSAATGAVPTFVIGAAGVVVERGIEYALDNTQGETTTPQFRSPNDVIHHNVWGYEAAFGPDQELADVSNDVIRKYHHLNVKTQGLAGQPEVRQAHRDEDELAFHREIKAQLEKDHLLLGEMDERGKLTQKGLAEAQQRLEELGQELGGKFDTMSKDLGELVQDLHSRQKVERDRANVARTRGEITGYFGFMGGLAGLVGKPELENKLRQAGNLAGAIYDLKIDTLAGGLKDKPFAMMNGYLLAAQMAMSLLQKDQQAAQFDAVMAALQQISEQIEALRKEMNERFDRVDQKLDLILSQNLTHFETSDASLRLIRDKTEEVNQRIGLLQGMVEREFGSQADEKLTAWGQECLPTSRAGKVQALSSFKALKDCTSHYLFIAAGKFSNSSGIGESESSSASPGVTDQSARAYFRNLLALRGGLEDLGGDALVASKPEHWLYAARSYLKLLAANPRSAKNAAFDATTLEPEQIRVNAESLYQTGVRLQGFVSGLALTFDGSAYALREKLFLDVLAKYETAAGKYLDSFSTRLTEQRSDGPDLVRQFADAPNLIAEADFPFLVQPLELCPGVGVEIPDDFSSNGFRRDWDQSNRVARMRGFPPGKLVLGKNLFPFLPPSVLWGVRMKSQGLNLKISACISKAKFYRYQPRYDNGTMFPSGMDISFGMGIDFVGTYDGPAGPVTKVLAHIGGYREFRTPYHDPHWGQSPIHTVWTGEPRSEEGVRLMPNLNGSFGIVNSPGEFFRGAESVPAALQMPVTTGGFFGIANRMMNQTMDFVRTSLIQQIMGDVAATDAARREFEARFSEKLGQRRNSIRADLAELEKGTQGTLDESLWQLAFLLSQGTDLQSDQARSLLAYLQSGGLPRPADLADLVVAGRLSADQARDVLKSVTADLRQRIHTVAGEKNLRPGANRLTPTVYELGHVIRLLDPAAADRLRIAK